MTTQLEFLREADLCANHHQGDPVSEAAHESIKHDKQRIQLQVFEFIAARGRHGATCEEIEDALGLAHQTASARVTELLAGRQIQRAGAKRRTRSGRAAWVHTVAEGSAE